MQLRTASPQLCQASGCTTLVDDVTGEQSHTKPLRSHGFAWNGLVWWRASLARVIGIPPFPGSFLVLPVRCLEVSDNRKECNFTEPSFLGCRVYFMTAVIIAIVFARPIVFARLKVFVGGLGGFGLEVAAFSCS